MTTLGLLNWFAGQGLLMDTVALAAIALVGYLFGRTRRDAFPLPDAKMRDELARAQQIAAELDAISERLRSEETTFEARLDEFRRDLKKMDVGAAPANWRRLSSQADAIVGPTMRLSTHLVKAHNELQNFHSQLLTFAGTRLDHATGLQNRRAMEEHLDAQLSLHNDGARRFAFAVFSISAARRGELLAGEGRLKAVAHLIQDCVRGSDLVARYSDDELAVLMPLTPLAGGMVFCERLLRRAMADLGCPLWGGLIEVKKGETSEKLLSRVESALYSARTQKGPCLFHHNGSTACRHLFKIDDPRVSEAPNDSPQGALGREGMAVVARIG